MSVPYRSYSDFLAQYFDGKVQKISIDLGHTCPNRDGSKGSGGCIYCNNEAFSPDAAKRGLDVSQQIERGKAFFARKYPKMRYLAYFQSYTSTYSSTTSLISVYEKALQCNGIVGLVIGTRPDCMPDALLHELSALQKRNGCPIFIEYGIETLHDSTLRTINRCHTSYESVSAINRTAAAGFPIGIHLILGLPGETEAMMTETVQRISTLPVSTVKFHQLQILRGTRLADMLQKNEIDACTFTSAEEYAALCARLLRHLRTDIAVDRFVAQAPDNLLLAPRWGLKNYQFEALLRKAIADLELLQ